MTRIRLLTVRNPWAYALLHLGKEVENRTRNIAGSYTGPVAILAGRQLDRWAYESSTLAHAANLADAPSMATMPRGIVGVMDLTGVHGTHDECMTQQRDGDWTTCSEWAERGTVHLQLANPRLLPEPIPFPGSLAMLWLDEALSARIMAEVGA